MNAIRSKTLILGIGILGGWLLAGATRDRTADSGSAPSEQAPRNAGATAVIDPSELRKWSTQAIPAEDFEGILGIRGSPALNIEHQFANASEQNLIFPNTESLEALSNWLDLSSTERQLLLEILQQTAVRQIEWERGNLSVERLETGKYDLRWREPPNDTIAKLKQDLAEAFGPALARSIWIRGGLDRYFEPLPGWKRRGIEKITAQVLIMNAGKQSSIRVSNGDFERVWSSEAETGRNLGPVRLQHLLDIEADVAAMTTKAAEMGGKSKYPQADWDRPGFVLSPYNGKRIDVRDYPPGTLVMDPTMPSEANAYFRIPPEP